MRGVIRSTGLALLVGSFAAWGVGSGCPGGLGQASLERTGPESRGDLPGSIRGILPESAILCLEEATQEGAVRRWIFRDPAGTWLGTPGSPVRPERHDMPPSALESILATRLPALDRGTLRERKCRYTHWKEADGSEVQVREIVSDRGWFACVEQVRI